MCSTIFWENVTVTEHYVLTILYDKSY